MAKPDREKTDQERHPENYFTSPAGHPRDRIRIHESAEFPKGGLFFALNGYAFMAKPEVEIDLPRPVRLMLDTLYRTETIQDTTGATQSRNIRRVTYTLIKEDVNAIPDAAVIAATGKQEADKQVDFP
jgi:hypothetical protein